MTQKICHINKIFLSSSKNFLLKNTFKVTLQYLINIFILFNTVSYIEIRLKLKIDPKICTFKNRKKLRKPGKNFEKTSGNPDKSIKKIKKKTLRGHVIFVKPASFN